MKVPQILGILLLFATTGNLLHAAPRYAPHVLYAFPAREYAANSLVQGRDGDFYGTTSFGGDTQDGTVFRISRNGKFETLVSFAYFDTGSRPQSGLILGRDGNFYGTTEIGGPLYGSVGGGSIFKVTPEGELTTMTSFALTNGYSPYARLVEGSDGNFYGTTLGGYYDPSQPGDPNYRSGTVFRMTPQGELTTLVFFNRQLGYGLYAGLVQGGDGNFYGTTFYGGLNDRGTVFKMTPSGQLTTLVSFDGANGDGPFAGLVEGRDGNFYGTTFYGGADDMGTVFQITANGTLRTLVSFNNQSGSHPHAEVIEGSDGNFYGTTDGGGDCGVGTVFKMSKDGMLTTLFAFPCGGSNPYFETQFPSALVQGMDGRFYGAASGTRQYPATIYRFGKPSRTMSKP